MKGHPEEEEEINEGQEDRLPGEEYRRPVEGEEEEDFFNDYLGSLKQKTKDCIKNKIDEIITKSKLKFVNDIAEQGVKIEEHGVKIADLENTYIKEYLRVTDPNKIKKTIGVNDSSLRFGLSTIADFDGNPSGSSNKNLLGNISLGHNCSGNLVAQDKIPFIKGKRNVSIGNGALGFNEAGDFNSCVGHKAMIYNVIGSANSALGFAALSDNLVGKNNTAIGSSALTFNYGSSNSALGRWAGRPLDGKTKLYWDWTTCVGSETQATNSYQVVLGTDLQTVHQFLPSQIRSSDPRYQKNSGPCPLSLKFINKLNPIQFQTINSNPLDKSPRINLGLNAADVKAALDSELNPGADYALYTNEALRGGFAGESIIYTDLIMPMINAIQDLSKQVEEMKEVIEKFKGKKRFGGF